MLHSGMVMILSLLVCLAMVLLCIYPDWIWQTLKHLRSIFAGPEGQLRQIHDVLKKRTIQVTGERFDKTLLKLVADCSALALNPSKKETTSKSPLKIALFSLAKMCSNHQICRQFVKSSESFPVIARLKQSPETNIAHYASVIVAKVGGDS